jgi:hypothetical protein
VISANITKHVMFCFGYPLVQSISYISLLLIKKMLASYGPNWSEDQIESVHSDLGALKS